MKKYLIPFTNWRIAVLSLLAVLALVLIIAEADNIALLLAIKASGFAIGYACYRLSTLWDKRGLIDELKVFSEGL